MRRWFRIWRRKVQCTEGAGTVCSLGLFVLFSASFTASAQTLAAPTVNSPVLSLPGESLIPAALGVRTDRKGHSWNVERNGTLGRVGSTMVNSGLSLSINQEKFETFQPRMTKDGKEFVIHGRMLKGLAGIQMVRRIRFIEETGALRYLEMFFNSTASPVTLDLELATSFSGNYKTSVTDRANIDPVLLGEGESGVLVTPGSSQANRAFLFVLCGPDASEKPTISAQSRYGLKFQYQITLAPGETKGIAHVVTQTIIPRELDRKSLGKLFGPYLLERIDRTIPDSFKDAIANRSEKPSRNGLLLSGDTVDSLGIDQLDDADVLAMGDQTRLLGSASFAPLTIETNFGEATIPAENVAALVGKNRGLRDRVRIFLKDGQILSGEIPEGEVRFAMKGGGIMSLTPEKLDRLVMAKDKKKTGGRDGDSALVQTWTGDQFRLDGENDLQFFGLTPWGNLAFTLSDLSWLAPAPNDLPGYQVRLKDGTECLIYLSSRDLILNSGYLGDLTLSFNTVRAIIPGGARSNQTETATPSRASLAGDQLVMGTLDEDEIEIFSNGQKIVIDPGEVRRIVSGTGATPAREPFLIEMWDGSRIEGILRSSHLKMKVTDQNWEIPLNDIIEIETAGPLLTAENREKVSALVVQLGEEDWNVRERATMDLAQFGYLAIPMLKGELNHNPDPEVRRRISRVLETFKEK